MFQIHSYNTDVVHSHRFPIQNTECIKDLDLGKSSMIIILVSFLTNFRVILLSVFLSHTHLSTNESFMYNLHVWLANTGITLGRDPGALKLDEGTPLSLPLAHSQVPTCFITCIINIIKYTSFKPITHLSFRISYLAPVLTVILPQVQVQNLVKFLCQALCLCAVYQMPSIKKAYLIM